MAAGGDIRVDGSSDTELTARGFALAPGETAEEFFAKRDALLRSAGVEPKWPGATEIKRKIEAGELGA